MERTPGRSPRRARAGSAKPGRAPVSRLSREERVRRKTAGLGVGGAVLAVVVAFFARGAMRSVIRGSSGGDSAQVAKSADLEWSAKRLVDAGVTLDFPDEPVRRTEVIDTDVGQQTATFYIYETPRLGFSLMYIDYGPDVEITNWDALLQGTAEGAAGGVAGTLVSIRPLEVAGRPAREAYVILDEPALSGAHIRAILDGRRLYLLMAVVPIVDSGAATRFFSSLRLHE